MTLSTLQRRTARAELLRDLHATGLTLFQVADDLDFDVDRLELALSMAVHADGSDVWLVRDYLAQAVRGSGGTPEPHTVLSEQTRLRARQWYRMDTPPHHDFSVRTQRQG